MLALFHLHVGVQATAVLTSQAKSLYKTTLRQSAQALPVYVWVQRLAQASLILTTLRADLHSMAETSARFSSSHMSLDFAWTLSSSW